MKQRAKFPSLVAAILVCMFIPIGWRGVVASFRTGAFRRPAVSIATDSYLSQAVGSNASQRIIEGLNRLPENKSLVFFARDGDSQNDFVAAVITYLAWPREVRAFSVPPEKIGAELSKLDPATVAALMFFKVEQPAFLGNGIKVSPDLEVFILGERK